MRRRNRRSNKTGRRQEKRPKTVTPPLPKYLEYLKNYKCSYRDDRGTLYTREAERCTHLPGPDFAKLREHKHIRKPDAPYLYQGGGTTPYSGGHTYGTSSSTYTYCSKKHWRTLVPLTEDSSVLASSWSDAPNTWWSDEETPRPARVVPDIGFYMDNLWINKKVVTAGINKPWGKPPGHVYIHYPWPDMSVPNDNEDAYEAIKWLAGQIAKGMIVDVGCYGGHGRTGTVLASLLVFNGILPGKAIKTIRETYCSEAVETKNQCAFVVSVWKRAQLETGGSVDEKLPKEDEKLLEAEADKCWKAGTTTSTTSWSSGTTLGDDMGYDADALPSGYHVVKDEAAASGAYCLCGHRHSDHQSFMFEDVLNWWCMGYDEAQAKRDLEYKGCKCDMWEPEELGFTPEPVLKAKDTTLARVYAKTENKSDFCIVKEGCQYKDICDFEQSVCFMKEVV